MGAATAWALTKSGHGVLLVEQFALGHERGSSHGTSRIFRFSYPEEQYVGMALAALPLWRDLEADAGRDLLFVTGGFDTGRTLDDHARALAAHDVSFEILDASEASVRWPMFRFRDGPVLFQPHAGYVAADAAVRAFVDSATTRGATVATGERVVALEPAARSVVVVTDTRRIEAGVVVVAAGAWARPLLATAGIDLPVVVTRETVAYFAASQATFPALVEWEDPAVYSLVAPGVGLKAGEHVAGPAVDPDDRGAPDPDAVERLRTWIGERYTGVDPSPVAAQTCLYTNTADQSFVLERHGPIVVGSPCSGHGFKFAPLIGSRLAAMAVE